MAELIKVKNKLGDEYLAPSDVFMGEENHPQCCFFELMNISPNPYEEIYAGKLCHMDARQDAGICNGDYLLCPLAKN